MKKPLIALVLGAVALSTPAVALDQIVHQFFSPRSAGMGGVHYSTGLYEENFFGNPARVLANPTWKLVLVDVTADVNSNVKDFVQNETKSDDKVAALGNTTGKNNHARIATAMPALYLSKKQTGRMAYALGLVTSEQADVDIRRSGNLSPDAYVDVGPAFTVGRSFLENENLDVGITAHYTYRAATSNSFTFTDLIKGKSIGPAQNGGDGTSLDFDLGTTYTPEHTLHSKIVPSFAFAVNNIAGGKYRNQLSLLKTGNLPPDANRSFNFGISGTTQALHFFGDTVGALELTDVGNNTNGSFYRLVHVGFETHISPILAPRVGINQGYFTAGLGVNLKIIMIDVATYGEEMALNAGRLEDRRYALRLALQI